VETPRVQPLGIGTLVAWEELLIVAALGLARIGGRVRLGRRAMEW
jgi:hypothetical protein